MTVSVVGLGYIGLPTALMLAANGVTVEAVDCNQALVETLRRGNVSFEEKGLPELFQRAVTNGIHFGCEYVAADIYIIAVPTPYKPDTKKIDATYVVKAVENVVEVCPTGAIVVVESTISPGTIDRYIRPAIAAQGRKLGEDIHIAHAPERIIPGNMLYELENNARTIGADSLDVAARVRNVYTSFCKGNIVLTGVREAEMSKVVENTFRDINIAFANELAQICSREGIDVYEVIRIANMHPRVNILQPGPGVGGHCISVDPWFLVGDYPDIALLIRQARQVNDGMPSYVFNRIKKLMASNHITSLSRVGLYGLTYKEDVDDIRESPTLQLIDVIRTQSDELPLVFDPMVKCRVLDNQCDSYEAFLNSVDMVVIMVGHTHLRQRSVSLDSKVVYDTRNLGIEHAKRL